MAIIKIVKKSDMLPPLSETSLMGWMKKHLLSSVLNSLLTIVTLYIIFITLKGLWAWGIADAVWVAANRRECFNISADGVCWAGVISWLDSIFYGRYPREELWRINLGLLFLFIWMAPLWLPRVKAKITIGLTTVFLYPFLAGYLFSGGDKGIFLQIMLTAAIVCLAGNTIHAIIGVFTGCSLPEFLLSLFGKKDAQEKSQRNLFITIITICFVLVFVCQMSWNVEGVPWTKWGGLFLTLVISGIGIASALPGGIILALGRRSKMPLVRALSISFIELFRSVPLITVLFMATTMFPLFMPEGFALNKLVQVIIAVCLFNACYIWLRSYAGAFRPSPRASLKRLTP